MILGVVMGGTIDVVGTAIGDTNAEDKAIGDTTNDEGMAICDTTNAEGMAICDTTIVEDMVKGDTTVVEDTAKGDTTGVGIEVAENGKEEMELNPSRANIRMTLKECSG